MSYRDNPNLFSRHYKRVMRNSIYLLVLSSCHAVEEENQSLYARISRVQNLRDLSDVVKDDVY